MKAREIAEWLGGSVVGDPETEVSTPGRIDSAGPSDVTFLSNPKYEPMLKDCRAGVVLVSKKVSLPERGAGRSAYVVVDDPYSGFARCVARLAPQPEPYPPGVHPTAVVPASARIGQNVTISAHCVLGENTVVGDGTRIGPLCSIARDSVIGRSCLLHARVTLYPGCVLGDRVTLHSGCVLGADGFGFAPQANGEWMKIPQVGRVVVEDDAEIGANTTIDRAMLAETRIGRGVKIDNLVMIAHNCIIGAHTAIAGQVGIAGSAHVGEHCIIGGQSGVNGHISVADRSTLSARSGFTKPVPVPGGTYLGYPAKPKSAALRHEAQLLRVPRMEAAIKRLTEELEELKAQRAKKKQPSKGRK